VKLSPVPIVNPLSIEPSKFNLTIPLQLVPLYELKYPITIIFPSSWIFKSYTVPELNPVLANPEPMLKVVSIDPSEFNLIILLQLVPLYSIKVPPTNIFPSYCTLIRYTAALNPVPISNVLSIVAFEFNLTNLFRLVLK
jgi:hypothetical protein